MRRIRRLATVPTLVGMIFALDLLWALLVGSTGSVFYAVVDEPAHLATCAVILGLLGAASKTGIPTGLVVSALAASVAIDLDHLPHLLGSEVLTGGLPRPYGHSLLLAAGIAVAAVCSPHRKGRLVLAGLSLGVAAHLLRDTATGPGIPLLWPFFGGIAQMPYGIYAATLVAIGIWAPGPSIAARPPSVAVARRGRIAVAALALAVVAVPPAAASALPKISTGAFIPGADQDPGLIDQFAQETGRPPAILSSYRIWGPPLIDSHQLSEASSRGSVPMLTWEPWDTSEQGVSLSAIAGGEEDGYITQVAQEAAAWGGPIFLRFAHEMNGTWYPWGWGNNGSNPASYKSAWRHLVEIFRASGATNVRWVWCPYVSNVRLKQFRRFYPGDEYVDWACLDGFNWGSYRTWQSFREIFDLSYGKIVETTRRPIMIGETGVNQFGGNKPRWLTRTLRKVLPGYRHLRAIVWFSAVDHRADLRVDSSPQSLAAFRGALSLPLFAGGAEALLNTPPLLAAPKKKHRGQRQRRHQVR